MTKLTAKQDIFCREYLVDLNAHQAAVRAGYSEKTAKQMGCENLSKPYLAEYIAELKGERQESVSVRASYVLERLYEIDQLDVLDIINDDLSGFKPLSEWPKSWRISVNAVDIKKMVSVNGGGDPIESVVEKIKWPDKTRNLELLGRHIDVGAFDGESSVSDQPVTKVQIEIVGGS